MDAKKTGALIAARRRALGLTQKQLSETLHVSDKAVSKWETGGSYPEITLLPALAHTLGVTVDELLAGEAPPEEPAPASPEAHADEAPPPPRAADEAARMEDCDNRLLFGWLAGILLAGAPFAGGIMSVPFVERYTLWGVAALLLTGLLLWHSAKRTRLADGAPEAAALSRRRVRLLWGVGAASLLVLIAGRTFFGILAFADSRPFDALLSRLTQEQLSNGTLTSRPTLLFDYSGLIYGWPLYLPAQAAIWLTLLVPLGLAAVRFRRMRPETPRLRPLAPVLSLVYMLAAGWIALLCRIFAVPGLDKTALFEQFGDDLWRGAGVPFSALYPWLPWAMTAAAAVIGALLWRRTKNVPAAVFLPVGTALSCAGARWNTTLGAQYLPMELQYGPDAAFVLQLTVHSGQVYLTVCVCLILMYAAVLWPGKAD